MAVHGQEELEHEGRGIRRTTRASLMSDTKWRKLFKAIQNSDLGLEQYVVKFIEVADEKTVDSNIMLHPPRPWIEVSPFSVIPIRSIEWLLIPRFAEYEPGVHGAPKRRVAQNVDGAAALIASLGKYPMEMSERGLMFTGYLPSVG